MTAAWTEVTCEGVTSGAGTDNPSRALDFTSFNLAESVVANLGVVLGMGTPFYHQLFWMGISWNSP